MTGPLNRADAQFLSWEDREELVLGFGARLFDETAYAIGKHIMQMREPRIDKLVETLHANAGHAYMALVHMWTLDNEEVSKLT